MDKERLIDRIEGFLQEAELKPIRIMEVCGTHTQAISKSGIRYLLPNQVKLLSGPGCPVCVTNEAYIDMAIDLISQENVILATFGDMLKVTGSTSCLAEKKTNNVYTVYSPEDAVDLALKHQDKTVIFLAVGFETTAPIIAATIKNVFENGPTNLLFLTSLKRMEPVIRLILNEDKKRIDGLILPGHVAAVLGAEAFRFVTDEFKIPSVVCGFEAKDMAEGIHLLLDQITGRTPLSFANLYDRCVSPGGNKLAQQYINEVFEVKDGIWRGIGKVHNSALMINQKYKRLDATHKFTLSEKMYPESSHCQCSEIILGMKSPFECHLFGEGCTTEHPLGPCMISSEGACAIHYRYGRVHNCLAK
ncbi:hydrogenase formation protein HypD [Clostridium aminobutyricum]|uniref:Hydrogenase formation protein HypD n=1 Tax=Clostridium aminobutyricum TaxID=33953 RepID=A0A939IJC6_CLOAM|nr:hydrogenase formation protein HypD [Clostridium aminobutyricum]MBN7773966.1 hydrogenase formation protein HypD [Clostridium aminobutyricum]